MDKLSLFTKKTGFIVSMSFIILTAMAVTFKPAAPGIEILYGEVSIANEHANFEIENGTDWETFYGLVAESDEPDEIRTYTIKNTGDAPLTIQNISIENLEDEFFSIVEEPASNTIAPGDTVSFKIGFTFMAFGVSAAKIGITTNDPVIPTYYIYMLANSIECEDCPDKKNGGIKCKECADKYDPLSYPACDTCKTVYMVNECTACIFPGQDIKTYCETCEDPNKRWPRCYM